MQSSAGLQWDVPQNKASHWEIHSHSGVASICPWSHWKRFLSWKIAFGYKASQRDGKEIFIAPLQRWNTMGSTTCPVFTSGRKALQSLFLTCRDSHHQRCCQWLYMTSRPSPRLLLISTSKAEWIKSPRRDMTWETGQLGRRQRADGVREFISSRAVSIGGLQQFAGLEMARPLVLAEACSVQDPGRVRKRKG